MCVALCGGKHLCREAGEGGGEGGDQRPHMASRRPGPLDRSLRIVSTAASAWDVQPLSLRWGTSTEIAASTPIPCGVSMWGACWQLH